MKKLMFAAAAIAAGVACADVTSANIVGYMDKGLRDAHKMIAPMFVSVDKQDGIKLSDLSVNGYTPYDPVGFGGGTDGEVYIKILDNTGAIATDPVTKERLWYFWYDSMATDPQFGYAGPGWYKEGAAEKYDADKVVFDAGAGLWVYGVNGYNILCDGQVLTGNATIPLRDAHLPTGNPFATAIKLSGISVTGYTPYDPVGFGGGTDGEVYIKILDNTGAIATDPVSKERLWYFWYDSMATDPQFGYPGPGWYKEGATEKYDADKVEFAAGDGLWVYGVNGYNLNIATPLADLNK